MCHPHLSAPNDTRQLTSCLSQRAMTNRSRTSSRYARSAKRKKSMRQSIRGYKRNLAILNSRYSEFERRVFDQIAETDRRSFIVEPGFDILLLHAVNDGLLKRVELAPVGAQRGEPTHYTYEVTDEGLDFINRYVCGEDIS